MTGRRTTVGVAIVMAALPAAPASAETTAASFTSLSGAVRGSVFAREDGDQVAGTIRLAATQDPPTEEISFVYAAGGCGRPPGAAVELARAVVSKEAAMNMQFRVATPGGGLAAVRSFRARLGGRQVLCARATALRPAAGSTKPDVLVAEGAFRDQGIDVLLVVRPRARRFGYSATLLSSEGAFPKVGFTLSGGAVKPLRWDVPDLDSDQSGMVVARGSVAGRAGRLAKMRTLKVEADGALAGRRTVERYRL